MYYLYNDKNEYCGYSDIKNSDNCTNIPVEKIVTSKDKVFFNKEKNQWEYDFYDFEKSIYVSNFFNSPEHMYYSIFNACNVSNGTYTKPKEKEITILIPCYGKANYIEETVKSCVNQTMKAYQIIVLLMDEESQKLKDKLENLYDNIKCIIHKRLLVSAARNYLVSICPTEYFVFLDADDILSNNYIEEVYKVKGSIVFTSKKIIDANKKITNLRTEKPFLYLTNCNLTALLNKEAFYELNKINEKINISEDIEFIIKLVFKEKWFIEITDKTYYIYRVFTKNSLYQEAFLKNGCADSFKLFLKNKELFIKKISEGNYWRKNFYISELKKISEGNIKNYAKYFSKNEISLKLWFQKKLLESKKRTTNNIFNIENYYIPDGINIDILKNKKFDVYILNNNNLVIEKNIKKEFDKIKDYYYNKIIWLLENYNCFYEGTEFESFYNNIIPKEKSLLFILNRKCNLSCEYCEQQDYQKNLSDNEIYNNFDELLTYFEKKCLDENIILDISLMGGEISIFSDYLIKKILNRIKKYNKFYIFTNNIIKNKLLEKELKIIKFVHLLDLKNLETYKNNINSYFIYIATHKNINDIKNFIFNTDTNININIEPNSFYNDKTKELQLTEEDFDELGKFFEIIKGSDPDKFKKCYKHTIQIDCIDKTANNCCYEKKTNYLSLKFKVPRELCKICNNFIIGGKKC